MPLEERFQPPAVLTIVEHSAVFYAVCMHVQLHLQSGRPLTVDNWNWYVARARETVKSIEEDTRFH